MRELSLAYIRVEIEMKQKKSTYNHHQAIAGLYQNTQPKKRIHHFMVCVVRFNSFEIGKQC